MTKAEIIEETAKFYTLDNRGMHEGYCTYLNPTNGCKCAVGRCVNDVWLTPDTYYGTIRFVVDDVLKNRGISMDETLKEEYRGHDLQFWKDLQSFHDAETNWTYAGLSEKGEEERLYLLNKYRDS